jgi:hypothetical protein
MVNSWDKATLNAMLDAETDQLCGVGRYERSALLGDTRVGSYERTLYTSAGEARGVDNMAFLSMAIAFFNVFTVQTLMPLRMNSVCRVCQPTKGGKPWTGRFGR